MFWHDGECLGYANPLRLMAVSSSLGYRIKYEYAEATWGVDVQEEWLYPVRVLALNATVDDCAPLVVQCTGLTKNWPSLSFSNQMGGLYAGTITDSLGRAHVYTANADGITSVRLPGSSSNDISITYTNGRVSSLTTGGETWTYSYSDNSQGDRRTTTVTDPGGHQTVTFSNLIGLRVLSHTNKANETTSYQYNPKRRLKRITRPEGDYVEYEYDTRGNIKKITEVAKPGSGLPDIVTTRVFPVDCTNPVTCNKPTAITDPRGNVTNFTYNTTHGGVTKVEQPAVTGGRPTTTYAYVSLAAYSGSVWRLRTIRACATAATCTNSVNETETTIYYKPDSRLPSRIDVRAGDESGTISITNMTHDHNDDVLTIDGPRTGTADTVYFRYDALRRQLGTIGPDPDGGGALKRRAEHVTFNTRGLPSVSERGTVTGVSDADWSAFASLLKQTMAYDSHGRLTKTTRISGGATHLVTQYSYDAEGRPQCTAIRMNPAVFGALPGACSLSTLGAFGADRIARTLYDSADRVNQVTTAYGTGVAADETQGYTANGLVSWVQDGKGNRSTYEYDGFDRLAKLRYPHPTTAGTSSSTDYDGYTYDAASNVTQQRLRDGQTVAYTYDNINRVTLRNAPGSSNDQTFTYDLLGRQLSVAISGHTNSFTYNALGQLTSATSPLGTLSYLYGPGGRLGRVTYPDGFYVEYHYDMAGAMTKVRENGATSGVGLLAVYSYDDLGRRTAITRGNGVTTTFTYEPNAKLDTLTQNLAGTTTDQSLIFNYNPAGQIASRTASNDAYAWTNHANMDVLTGVNGRNQITTEGGVTFSHDGRGNMTSDGTATYGYDADNRLTSAPGGAVLKYDAVGRLFEASASGLAATRFLYNGVSLVAEYNSAGVLQRRYVHGADVDEPLVWYEGSGTSDRRWLVSDERGSIIAATNSTGGPIAINSYDEYGSPDPGNLGRFQYTGQTWIEAIGLYHYKSRFYDPDLGRFLQTDRIGYSGGLNLYAYVADDPVNLSDPFGMDKDGGVDPPECMDPSGCIEVTGKRPDRQPPSLRWVSFTGDGGWRKGDAKSEEKNQCPNPTNGDSHAASTGMVTVGVVSDKLVGLKIASAATGTVLGGYDLLEGFGVVAGAPRLEDYTGAGNAAVIHLYTGYSAGITGYGVAWAATGTAGVWGGVAIVFGAGLTVGHGLDLGSEAVFGQSVSSKLADWACGCTGNC